MTTTNKRCGKAEAAQRAFIPLALFQPTIFALSWQH
jgi:hypothetical protein